MTELPVGDLMTSDVISIDPDLGVEMAVQLMGMHGVRRLPVLSRRGTLVGIITREEARVALQEARGHKEGRESAMPAVRDVMSRDVCSVSPDDSIGRAARTMVNHSVGGLPVVLDHKLVGIITESDIFKHLAKQIEEPDVGPAAAGSRR